MKTLTTNGQTFPNVADAIGINLTQPKVGRVHREADTKNALVAIRVKNDYREAIGDRTTAPSV